MAKSTLFLVLLQLAVTVSAGKYRLCTCITDDKYSEKATKAVVKNGEGKYIYSEFPWRISPHGAPLDGTYFHAIEGTVNNINNDGWIGAKEANGACKNNGADGATCWTPTTTWGYKTCGDQCWIGDELQTDENGNFVTATVSTTGYQSGLPSTPGTPIHTPMTPSTPTTDTPTSLITSTTQATTSTPGPSSRRTCKFTIRNSSNSQVGSVCVDAGDSGSVYNSQTGKTVTFKTSILCGIDATGGLGENESLNHEGSC